MKRKNILKFVSLLGIGSFVMLAAASCTSATTPTPNPPSNGGGMMSDNPNPGNTTPKQQLAAGRKTLTDLLGTENTNVALYADYANIQSTLSTAYMTAKTASENTSATLDNLRSASTTLQAAIDKAASDKRAFDSANQPLVTAYNQLKTTLQSKTTSLEGLSENKYSGIKKHVSEMFDAGSAITARTLDPTNDERPTLEKVNEANNSIKMAISPESLKNWKDNADKFNDFEKKPLSKTQLSAGEDSAHNQEQPANWSFAGYSVDITTGSASNSQNLPNWNFAQRKVWTSEAARNNGSIDLVANPTVPTDVSWIYSLTGQGTKYTLEFTYYGPSTAFLYFPYKLVKSADSSSVALQYNLNNTSPKLINFQPVRTEPANADSTTNETTTTGSSENRSSSETLVADEATSTNNEMNPTPTAADINIAKVTLSNLNFGTNTIEFSVSTTAEEGTSKVAPMIGNMYITSNDQNQRKIYNEIFGNTSNGSTSVTVDLLKGYSLASGWSTYVGEFKRLTGANQTASDSQTSAPNYLVGFIAGHGQRTVDNVSNIIRNPSIEGQQRTLAIYINAPVEGEYYISGSYLTNVARDLKFSTGETNNVLTITGLRQDNWQTLGKFDTSTMMTGITVTQGSNNKTTLKLKSGLNKVVITGGTANNTNAPDIGNLTFKLMTTTSNSETNTPA
ncbi:variably expressed lipoprotein and hemagglutinin (VlhA) family protein [Mycoplasmoides gallisepticum WI01_2001.043-13-2P]|uniref:Variably expressed lipoprotein and hemagglutinin (VlhA) family protein n=1 Tax=Mycoplasmoides gallisepticum WI01_2001.043-13-2P TaxID=1159201 RepID=J3YHU2_MYCGL|nr:FIVAR domain-containing protein [Mycoplasmoides gallisepticum]AFP79405.1 variably expressed lipoprotein and hemagglutinin (VlhA) family protein [Mycoplasmoides gallisepticum WI01_2001.043-13-2P]